jgi:hypothetical protein
LDLVSDEDLQTMQVCRWDFETELSILQACVRYEAWPMLRYLLYTRYSWNNKKGAYNKNDLEALGACNAIEVTSIIKDIPDHYRKVFEFVRCIVPVKQLVEIILGLSFRIS